MSVVTEFSHHLKIRNKHYEKNVEAVMINNSSNNNNTNNHLASWLTEHKLKKTRHLTLVIQVLAWDIVMSS